MPGLQPVVQLVREDDPEKFVILFLEVLEIRSLLRWCDKVSISHPSRVPAETGRDDELRLTYILTSAKPLHIILRIRLRLQLLRKELMLQ